MSSSVVSSNDVIDSLRDKITDVIYENAVLRAQLKASQREIEELKAKIQEGSE
jgi:chaperonin cofactor prefoldin